MQCYKLVHIKQLLCLLNCQNQVVFKLNIQLKIKHTHIFFVSVRRLSTIKSLSCFRVNDIHKFLPGIYKTVYLTVILLLLGSVFVRTDQLDGETDWKLRVAVPPCQQQLHSDQVSIVEQPYILKYYTCKILFLTSFLMLL